MTAGFCAVGAATEEAVHPRRVPFCCCVRAALCDGAGLSQQALILLQPVPQGQPEVGRGLESLLLARCREPRCAARSSSRLPKGLRLAHALSQRVLGLFLDSSSFLKLQRTAPGALLAPQETGLPWETLWALACHRDCVTSLLCTQSHWVPPMRHLLHVEMEAARGIESVVQASSFNSQWTGCLSVITGVWCGLHSTLL